MTNLDNLLDEIETKLKLNLNTQRYNNYNIFPNNLNNNNSQFLQNQNNIKRFNNYISSNDINQRNETREIIKNEMSPYYDDNTGNLMKYELNKINNEIEQLKNNEFNIDKIHNEINDINKKLYQIEVDTLLLEKNIKSNDEIFKNSVVEGNNNNQNIINKYNEIEKKYDELQDKIKMIKEEQNQIGAELMINKKNDNNFEEELEKIENKLNNFLNERNIKFNNRIQDLYKKYIDTSEIKGNEINKIKFELKNSEEKLNNVNISLNPLKEIPKIKNNIDTLNEALDKANKKFELVIKQHEKMNLNNNELSKSLINTNKNIDNINSKIAINQKNFDEIKNNIIDKNDLKDINDKIENIKNKINILKGKEGNSKNIIKTTNEDLNAMNQNSEKMISKEEYNNNISKKEKELRDLKDINLNKINEYNEHYNNLLNQFNKFNENETNVMIDFNKQLKEASDKVNQNKNDINNLAENNNNIYKNFVKIKKDFKIVDKNIANIQILENKNFKNQKEIEKINDEIKILEENIKKNKEEVDNFELENLGDLDNFNNKINNIKESKDNSLKELVKEEENSESKFENLIKEFNQKQENDINNFINKLNEIKNEQIIVNQQNMKEIDDLNKNISEKMNEFENIKRSLGNENNDNNKALIEKRIDNLNREIDDLIEFSKKMHILMEQNMAENNSKFDEINEQIDIFKQTISEKLKETKKYIDTTLENISKN